MSTQNSETPRTNVILVVVTNKANKTLGHDKYFKVFSQFGTIQRMLIFERSLTWKTFVEFDNPDSAARAKQTLNEKPFNDDPTLLMNVYASKLSYITFQENNTGGVDYTVLRQKQKEPIVKQQVTPQQTVMNNYHFLQQQMQFQHQMSQQIQQMNNLMGQLQTACSEGFQSTLSQSQDLQSQIEKQQSILKDIADQQNNFQTLTETYSTFLIGLNKTDDVQSPNTMQQQQTAKQRKKLTIPADIAQNKQGEQIEFIQSYHESDITRDPVYHSQQSQQSQHSQPSKQQTQLHSQDHLIDQLQAQQLFMSQGKQSSKVDDLNFDGLSLRDSDDAESNHDEQHESDDEEENELFKYFKNDKHSMSELDKQQIFNKLNHDMQFQDAQFNDKQAIQNTNEKSSKSVDNIEYLIHNSKLMNAQSKSQTIGNEKIEEYVNPLFLKVARKSKVIYARWFDKKVVTSQMLYNIFSTYGNIDKMIYLKERSSALVQYFIQDHAAIAKESLNDVNFYGQAIKIFFSNYEEISLKVQPTRPGEICSDPKTGEEYFQGGEETNRIKPDSTYTLAPPCDTIQVSNLSKNLIQGQVISQYFSGFGQIKALKFVNNGTKPMCVLKYNTMEVALTVLANLHGADLDDKRVSINFSKQKL